MMKKLYFYIHLIIALLMITSCSNDDDITCDSFNDVKKLQQNTINGMPTGSMVLNVQGTGVRNYQTDLPFILSQFNYMKNLYFYECDTNSGFDEDLTDYYHEAARYYAGILMIQYIAAKSLILEFDGVSNFRLLLRPVDPSSTEPDVLLLSITDLIAGDIGVEITLDVTTVNRRFDVDYESYIFTSAEAGSSLKVKIHSIRPVGQITQVELIAGSILFNDTGNLESVSIGGVLNAYRK
jgi:hypothetical protein